MKPSNGKKPHLVITVGIPGSGKSLFAEHFAKTFNAPIISFNQLKKQLFCNEIINKKQYDNLVNVVTGILSEVLKTKQTTVFDGITNLRSERHAISKIARDAGYEPLFVWVQTDQTTARKRSKITKSQFDSDTKRFSPPHSSEKAIVISGKHTYNSQLKIILKHLANVIEPAKTQKPPLRRRFLIR